MAYVLNTKFYFTRPYTSQDKGTVENRIGVTGGSFLRNISKRDKPTKSSKSGDNDYSNPAKGFNCHSPVQKLKTKCVALIC